VNDPAAMLEAFEATLRNQVAFVLETAAGSPAGGGPAWAGVLERFGIEGAPPDRRGAVAASRGQTRGAFPEEVEAVLLALSHLASVTLRQMQTMAAEEPHAQARLQSLVGRVSTLATDQRRAYEDLLRPRPVVGAGVAGIFANARATAQLDPWRSCKYDDHLTLSCPGCGAPQQAHLVFDCRFCGSSLFGPAGPS
jgi:hypothetical protein